MTDKMITVMIIWLIIIVIGYAVVKAAVSWDKQPRLTAVIASYEFHERRAHSAAYWQVTYEFRDAQGNTQQDSCRWSKGEEPSVGQEIVICYNPKNGKSVIEGTYTMKGAKILIAVMILWGLLSTICILLGLDVSRRRH